MSVNIEARKMLKIWVLFYLGLQCVLGTPTLLPPPRELLDVPLKTFKRTLVGGGPTNYYPRGPAALSLPAMGNFETDSLKVMEDVKKGLRYIFQTENPWTLPLSGSGSAAIDAVMDNMIEPGDIVLIPTYGLWSIRAADIAERLGGIVKTIEKPLGSTFSIKEIEAAIIEHKPTIVYITNGESSTGVHQKIQGIGDICNKNNCYLIVDVVAIGAINPFYFDNWKVDAAFCNAQKGLGSMPGTAPITFSPRAVEKIMAREHKPKNYASDLKNCWVKNNYWGVDATRPQTFHSSYPVLQLYSLRETLATLAEEGLDRVWLRHENCTKKLYAGLDELGLKYFVSDPESRLIGTVAMIPPNGVNPKDLMGYIRNKFSLEINTGIGPTWNKLIRIGLFGPNAQPEIVDRLLEALKDGLQHFANGVSAIV